MSPKNIDFDIYYPKHCARYYGWLPAAKEHKKQIQRSPKYFTLCGRKAIDVFMFERAGVFARDNNGRLHNVIVCEEDEDAGSDIIDLVRPPVEEAVILGNLQDILTFEDDEDTQGRSPDEDEPSRKIREKLSTKGKFEQFKKHLPFDIINFDPWESLVGTPLEENKLCQAFKKIFQLQECVESFLLLVTTKITNIDLTVQSQFKEDFESNVSNYAQIGDALLSSVNTTTYDSIDENKRRALCFAKSIVMSAARSEHWNCEHQGIYIYEHEPGGTRMLSLVVQFAKPRGAPDESVYVEDIVRIIEHMPEYYSHAEACSDQEVVQDLGKIVEYRKETRDQYKQQP